MKNLTLDEYIAQEREHCIVRIRNGTYDEFMYFSGRQDTLEDIEHHVLGRPSNDHCVCGCRYDKHKQTLVSTHKAVTHLVCDCGCGTYQKDSDRKGGE
jgi:hypothetical protein